MYFNSCHVMAKPTGSVCNIDCGYCFYLEKEALYPERKQNWRMTDETLDNYIRQYIEAQDSKQVLFAWQGGEPTIMGIPFFKKVINLCKKYGQNREIKHALQTNGMLINEEWCDFFAEHDFLIGLSVDGPQKLHDTYRVTRSGLGTHDKVIKALDLLKKRDIKFNTLTVVGKHNAAYATDVYEFLVNAGSKYIQFIPLVERFNTTKCSVLNLATPNESKAALAPWTVPAREYGEFLSQIFDIWVKRDVGKILIQMFDVAIAAWMGQPPILCVHSETCGHAFALESNGDLYNCDHFVYPEHLLGNINQQSIRQLNNSEQAIAFGNAKKDSLTKDCLKCEFLPICHGGCPKHRFLISPTGQAGHNYLCAGYKHFFKHITSKMNMIRQLLDSGYPLEYIMLTDFFEKKTTKPKNRNEICNCGSGKKWKKCCDK